MLQTRTEQILGLSLLLCQYSFGLSSGLARCQWRAIFGRSIHLSHRCQALGTTPRAIVYLDARCPFEMLSKVTARSPRSDLVLYWSPYPVPRLVPRRVSGGISPKGDSTPLDQRPRQTRDDPVHDIQEDQRIRLPDEPQSCRPRPWPKPNARASGHVDCWQGPLRYSWSLQYQ